MKPRRPPGRAPGEAAARARPAAAPVAAAAASPPGRGAIAALATVLVAAVLIAYLPALEAGFIWDDDDYVTANTALLSLDGLRRIWLEPGAVPQYYPLTFTTFWLEHGLFGLDPTGYHLVNVLLHALNALLFWRLLVVLEIPGAWLAAAIFALHPIQVESVAWITERKNVLSTALYLGAALSYLRFSPPGRAPGVGPMGGYAAALLLFAAALLSKTVTASLPAALFLVLWWRRGQPPWRDLAWLAPLFALGLGGASITAWLERSHVGAIGAEWELSPAERVLVAGRALWFYAATLVWPRGLAFNYPRWQIDAGAWQQWLFPLAAAGVAMSLWLARRRLGTAPLFVLLLFAGTLVPALGFFDVYPMRYSFVADHFAYLATLAPIALAAAAGTTAAARLGPATARSGAAVLLAGLALLTWRQAHVYENLDTLWHDTLAKNPTSWMAHNNLGVIALSRGDAETAGEHFSRALAARAGDPELHNNYGNALRSQGRIEEAIAQYEEALDLEPSYSVAMSNLAGALALQGRSEEGLAHLERALRLAPSSEAHYNAAVLLLDLKRVDEAVPHLERAVALAPGDLDRRYAAGTLLLQHGRTAEAEVHLATVLRLNPEHAPAHINMGALLLGRGRLDEAVAHYQEAIRLQPGNAAAHTNLGIAYEMLGRPADAVEPYRAALRLQPSEAAAHRDLAGALARSGRTEEARGHLLDALRLDPGDSEAAAELERLGTPAGS